VAAKIISSSRDQNRFHRVPRVEENEWRNVARVIVRERHIPVGQCTTDLSRVTRQELPGALKSAPERSPCCIMQQAIPAAGRYEDVRPRGETDAL
jgi:hypothetical protein